MTRFGLRRLDQLRLRRGGKQRLGIAGRELVHRHHQLHRLDLPQRQHPLQDRDRVHVDVLVLQHVDDFGADAVEQAHLGTQKGDIDIERLGDALFRYAALDGLHDHLVLLHDRDAADAPVVGDGLIVGRQQTKHLRFAHVLEGLDPEMTIEQEVLAALRRAGA